MCVCYVKMWVFVCILCQEVFVCPLQDGKVLVCLCVSNVCVEIGRVDRQQAALTTQHDASTVCSWSVRHGSFARPSHSRSLTGCEFPPRPASSKHVRHHHSCAPHQSRARASRLRLMSSAPHCNAAVQTCAAPALALDSIETATARRAHRTRAATLCASKRLKNSLNSPLPWATT